MHLLARLLTAALVGLAVLAHGYPDPGACSGDCWTHDPAVVKRASDGAYFRFSTGGKIGIYKASSLTGPWTYQGAAIPAGSSINLDGKNDLWAPMVQLVDSTYYLYYAVSTFGSQNSAIGYATSATMEAGSWTDHGATGIASSAAKPYNAIDPALVQAADGAYHLSFGSFWSDIYQVRMAAPAPTGVAPGAASVQLAYNASGAHAQEGAFVYLRGATGYYYLFFSAGSCCGYDAARPAPGDEYSIRVCRSASVAGPYVDAAGVACTAGGGTKVLESHGKVYGPGGQGVLVDSAYGGTVLYYHYANTDIGLADANYQFGWNQISWSTGWPVLY